MNIYTIIVTYNGMKWYDKSFSSLLMSSVPVNVLVIDNASTDGTIDYIRKHFPNIHLIESKENLGFSKANNIGIKYAIEKNADYIFLLNQDAWVETDTIEKLLQTFLHNKMVGIASPIHLNGTYAGLDNGFRHYIGYYCISDAYMNNLQPYYEVPFVNAAAWLISRECIEKVGGFDTSLFKHYGEDDNYSQRVYYHGMKIVINTQCTICHDREQRKISPSDSSFNVDDPYYYEKCSKANILIDYDFNQQIINKKNSLIKAFLRLRFKTIKRLKRELNIEKQIAYSRENNKKGGLVWLDHM